MKSLKESLFDTDNITDEPINLYKTFGHHIARVKVDSHGSSGLLFNYELEDIHRLYKVYTAEKCPRLSGDLSRISENLNHLMSVILNRSVVFLKSADEDDVIHADNKSINRWMRDEEIRGFEDNIHVEVFLVGPKSKAKKWKRYKGYEIWMSFGKIKEKEIMIEHQYFLLTDVLDITEV